MYTPRHSFEAARDSATLVALLQWRAQKEPQQRAYIFLKDGENIEETMTYGELDQRARAIGALLQANQIASGTCVLLLYPPGLEYVAAFFGCLYSGVIAVPAYPPLRNQRSIQRLQAIIHDSQASAVLTTSRLLEQERLLFVTDWQLPGIKWLETDGDGMVEQLAGAWQEPPLSAGSLALLQYTSGSTSTPKGVMISHENLLHNLAVIEHCCGHTTESHGVTWAPPYHDLGLVGGVLQPVYGGFPVTFMSPFAFLQRPIRWLQALSRTKGTTSGGPNFAYELCIRKISPDECAALSIDLSHWSLAFCSAEPVYPSTFERFAQVFEPFGFRREAFYPCYGLAESTLLVTGGRKLTVPIIRHFNSAALTRNEVELEDGGGDTRSSTLISSGQVLPGYDLIIVDPATSLPCPPQRIGEIWIAGPCVAQGYWRRPEETEQFLQARPAGIPAEKTFLRSGDLGFLCEEELFVTGRLKDLIIIRGRNYYPQDIEQIASQSHPALRSGAGAAFSIDVSGEERLVLVHEIDRHYARQDKAPIIDAIRRAIAEELNIQTYAIVLIKAASLPKTTSGKVQRYACRKAFLERGLDIWEQSVFAPSEDEPHGNESQHVWLTPQVLLAAPGNQNALLESFLRQEIARLLNCDSAKINTSQPLSVFGLDSLVAIELGNSIEAHCGVALPLSYLLQGATIDEIVAAIHAKLQSDPSPKTMPQVQAIAPGEDAYPLSYGQQALWLLDSLSPHSPLYTIARAVKSKRKLDASALKRALQVLLERHDSLRAVFSVKDEQPVYKICREQEAFLVVENASDWDDDAVDTYLAEKSRLPFDLTKGPLLKTYLLERSGRDFILFFVVHHLVVDLWSLSILVRELGELYAREMRAIAVPLPQPEFHYHDFVRWQTGMLAENKGRQLKAYWENQLAGNLPFLNIHADYPRPALSTFKGSSISFSIDESISAKLQAFLQKKSITLYTALLAAFQILLYRYTGQEDIIIGSPVANRELQAFHDIVGYFANIIPIRSKVSGKLSCSTFLGQTRGEVLAALENQGYPFPLLVQHLQPERSSGTTPIIQVMFALQSIGGPDSKAMAALALNKPGEMFVINDLVLESLPLKNITSEFELALTLAETRSGIFASIEYSTELFEEATIQRLAQQYQRVIEQMVSDPNQRLDHLDVLPEEERQELLAGWNATARPYPEQRAVHQLFEDQARRCPQAIALTSQEESLSYHELNRRANCLAHYLQTLGVGPDILVGICLERSPEMVIAMLAILKAGGAYMPLDPTYPAHRLAFMLQDSKAAVLLTREQLCPHLPIAQAKLVCLDTQWERIAEYSETNIQSEANLGNLAYVIYTSGSTGQPKGVLVEHRGVVNHCLFFKERCDLQMDDRVLQFASLSFDTSVEEIFPSLISGATLVLRPPDVTDLPRFLRFVEDNGVTVLNLPTSYWNLWVSQLSSLEMPAFSLLRLVIVGSEKVFRKNFTLWKKHLGERIRWVNAYGPTEATVLATIYEPVPAHEDLGGDTVPIGRPIANTHLYVLDQHLQPVPIGVPGELFIGGAGVARGYLHRPELTAERFIPDPFSGDSKARLYKTGDLVRYLPDGNLEFLGRLDHQVKIRGFRIEPGEIEAVLIQHPAVREAVVVAHENSVGDNYLTAYLVAAQLPGPSSLELRSYLQERLMDYMVPSAFVSLDVLPLSPNGKIDRKALPPPEAKNYREEPRVYVPPRSSIERVIVGVWAEVLEVDHIGAFDDFFEWGGHSLLIIRVASRLRAIFQFELEVAALFQYTTAATLASYIEQMGRRANIDTVRIADLLLYLNTLSDEEIHTTLSDS